MSNLFISIPLLLSTLFPSPPVAQSGDVQNGTLYIGAATNSANVQHFFVKGQVVVLEVAAESPLKSVSMLSAPGLISARRAGVELARMEYEMLEDGNLEFRFEPRHDGTNNVVSYKISTLPVKEALVPVTAAE